MAIGGRPDRPGPKGVKGLGVNVTPAWGIKDRSRVRQTLRPQNSKPKLKPNLLLSPAPPSHDRTALLSQKESAMTLDLANPQHVAQYLSATPWAAKSITSLSGGYTNFVFRIELAEPYRGQERVILKHSKSYIPMAKEFSFSVERQVRFLHCSGQRGVMINRPSRSTRWQRWKK